MSFIGLSMTQDSENIYTAVGFRSSEPDGTLRTIELFGLPGQKNRDDQVVFMPERQSFFDDLIVRKIFRQSCKIRNCDFKHLQIWLYNTQLRNKDQGYSVPEIDERDLVIKSNFPFSRLEQIYVLNNNLEESEYQEWRSIVEELFTPLFSQFVPPPEIPKTIAEKQIFKPFENLFESLDTYGKMKQEVWFNSLIIQID